MSEYRVEALSEATWPASEALVAKHRLVVQGRTHHALVMDGDAAVGWCEYGTPEELPRIYHRKEYEASGIEPTRYRLPCFFVDRNHRRRGVATLALQGALDLIAAGGGGTVEGYPRVDVGERKMSASFLFSGSVGMFAGAGFTRGPDIGRFRCIMRRTVAPVAKQRESGRAGRS